MEEGSLPAFTMDDLLRLGWPIQPEQVFLHDEMPTGHAMAPWVIPDPIHEAHCYEDHLVGLEYTDTEDLVVVPVPLSFQPESWAWEEACQSFGADVVNHHPVVIAQADGDYHPQMFTRGVYRAWDLWPITSAEHDLLQKRFNRLMSQIGYGDLQAYAGHMSGEYDCSEELEDEPYMDVEAYEAAIEAEDEDLQQQLLEEAHERWDEYHAEVVMHAQQALTVANVRDTLDLYTIGLQTPWERLRRASKACWRRVARSVPEQERYSYMSAQKWLSPWP